jgi:hypothetical protein
VQPLHHAERIGLRVDFAFDGKHSPRPATRHDGTWRGGLFRAAPPTGLLLLQESPCSSSGRAAEVPSKVIPASKSGSQFNDQ